MPSSRCGSFCEPSIATLPRPMRQRGIAETAHQLGAIVGDAHARRRDERRRDLLGHLPLDERGQRGSLAACAIVSWPAQEAEVGERRMAAVQHAQLHRLERLDLAHQRRARGLPGRPRLRRTGPRSPTGCTARRRPAPRRARRGAARPRRCPRRSSPARCDRPSFRETRRVRRDPVDQRSIARRCASSLTSPSSTRPLCGRLSQQTMLSAPASRVATRVERRDQQADARTPARPDARGRARCRDARSRGARSPDRGNSLSR